MQEKIESEVLIMCYKDEMQQKNAKKLQRKFEENNVPVFIQRYFIRIDSKLGAILFIGLQLKIYFYGLFPPK